MILSEIHFHPAQDEEKQEFLELYNSGVEWVDLSGWQWTAGIEYTFPEGVILPPAGFLVLARDAAAVKALHKIENVVGDFKGNLSNTGETLELRNRGGSVVLWLTYGDGGRGQGFWPQSADGDGPSCELLEPHPDWHRSWFWRASLTPGGTPGRESSRRGAWRGVPEGASSRTDYSGLGINEVRLGSGTPLVELWNGGAGPMKLDGLKLTRDPLGSGGVPITGNLARRKALLVDATQAQPLADGGKRLYLLKSDSLEILDSAPLRKGVAAEGSAGRYPDGEGDFVTYSKASPGASNAKPQASDLVIHEILFHGRSVGEKGEEEEFVEIFNRGKSPVPLKGWKIDRATSFTFPDDAVLPPGGYAVVSNNPTKLRPRLSAEEQKLLFGPMKGKLSNAQGTVALLNAGGDVADRVPYRDRAPWPAGADGTGASLELLHPDLDNRWGQAWTLGPAGGTPGKKNARAVTAMAPILTGVRSEPAMPSSDEEVTIHAHVLDTGGLSEVSVVFRDVNSNAKPAKKSMADSGEVDDGAARDGHYAARLGKLRPGALVGFYVQARDTSGKATRWPEGDRECYLEVEPAPREAPRHPELTYHILMPRETWDRFRQSPHGQDTKFPCTFAATLEGPGSRGRRGQAFHGATLRYRGRASRRPSDGRMSYRVFLAAGDSFDGRDRIILNSQNPLRQKAGGEVMRLAGVTAPDVTLIRLKAPGFEDESYLDVEPVNNEFLDKRFGSSAGGIYRGDVMTRGGTGRSGSADLSYQGADKSYYLNTYLHGNKRAVTDIDAFIKALQAINTKGAAYTAEVEKAIDIDEWAAYFAANHVLKNDENGLSTGAADDYFIAKRPTDGKFILIAWDHDTVFTHRMGRGDYEPIYGPSLPVIRRFLWNPQFAPLYQAAIRRVLDGPLSRPSLEARLRTLEGRFPAEELADLESFTQKRQQTVRERFSLWPQATLQGGGIGDGEPIAGAGFGTRVYAPESAGAQAFVAGIVDPALAFKVRAGGEWANYDPVTGRWAAAKELSALVEGSNPLWVELVGAKGDVVQLHSIDLQKVPSAHSVPPELEGKVEWKAGSGPYVLQGPTVVPAGSVLSIGPGVDVVCAQGSSLQVRGTLIVDGSALDPVTFRPAGAGLGWGGVRLSKSSGSGDGHRISHARFEGGREGADGDDTDFPAARRSSSGGFFSMQATRALLDECLFRGIRGNAVACDSSNVILRGVRVVDGRAGILLRGGTVAVERCELARLTGDGLRIQQCEKEVSVKGLVARKVIEMALVIDGSKVAIESSLLVSGHTALALSGGARVRASKLTVAAVWRAVEIDRRRAARQSVRGAVTAQAGGEKSTLEVSDSVIGVVGEPISGSSAGQARFSRCLIAPGRGADTIQGDGVIRDLPRFRAAHLGDFHLEAGAPGKGAGTGGADWGFSL